MASLQNIKKRLTGVKNINQITAAMELVAATKMRRSQEVVLRSRPYALTALELLANLVEYLTSENTPVNFNPAHFPLLQDRVIQKTAVLLVAADKGLAGAFNSSVFKKFEVFLRTPRVQRETLIFVAVGQKAVDYLTRRGYPLHAHFTRQGDSIRVTEVEPIADLLAHGYETGAWDRVMVFSTHFTSALKQEVIERQLLPIDFEKIRATVEEIIPETGRFSELRRELILSRPSRPVEYLIEPSPDVALNHLLPLLFKMQVYHLILEANASEHSARRLAMKNASDNVLDLTVLLTREYNRSRQAAITKEIVEITSTAAAVTH